MSKKSIFSSVLISVILLSSCGNYIANVGMKSMDSNKDGNVSEVENTAQSLTDCRRESPNAVDDCLKKAKEQFAQILANFDKNGDKQLNKEEFKAYLRSR
jgi:PBP1b-binding outer membrane lipoprotein LpoB